MEKLYYKSAYIREFEAVVQSCEPVKHGFQVILDQTAFYPEGGGQPFDTGVLGGVSVLETHEKNGHVVHTLSAPLPVGEKVTGKIDWERRFSNMQGHSGEHLISGLIHAKYGYDNVGFHMGSEEITVDFNGLLEWEDLLQIERQANRLIWSDEKIEAFFPSKEELKTMDYRSKKELDGEIRIVRIPGGDTCACCGTHVERTGEIGLVKFTSMIHYKGGVRIGLLCGARAMEDYENKQARLMEISRLLSAKPGETAKAVGRLKHEAETLAEKVAQYGKKRMETLAESLPESGEDRYIIVSDAGKTELRHLANAVLEEKKAKKILALTENVEGGFLYVLGGLSEDVRPVTKELNSLLNGRGGGSMQMTQGTFYAERETLCAILKEKGFGEA